MKFKKLLRGFISYVPYLRLLIPKKGTGGSIDAEYCYNTYNTHKNLLNKVGCKFPVPNIGEIGPGDSLGIGLIALLDGSSNYFGLDTIQHSNKDINLKVLGDLNQLLAADNISIKESLISSLKASILNINNKDNSIRYNAPWESSELIKENHLDLVISNAVMEHVSDLEKTYNTIYKWLKPGAYTSHIIDYKAHEFSNVWYEHWTYSDITWKILMHGRKYPINRMPHSFHKKCLLAAGFEIVFEECTFSESSTSAPLSDINKTIKHLFSEDDLRIKAAVLIAKKV